MTYVKDFKACDVQNADEQRALLASFECDVALLDHPFEDAIEQRLGHGTDRVGHLIYVSALSYKFGADLDLGFAQILVQFIAIAEKQFCHQIAGLKMKQYIAIRKLNLILRYSPCI